MTGQPVSKPPTTDLPLPIANDEAQRAGQPSLGRMILRNTLIVSIGEGLIKILSFVFGIVTIRWLGVAVIGQRTTVIAFVGLFGVFFELGLSQYVERTIAQDRARAPALFWNLVLLRLLLALCGCILIPTSAWVVGYERNVIIGIALYTTTFIFAAVLAPLTTVLQANERFDVTATVAVINQVITVSLGLLLLSLGYSFLALLCIGFVAMPVQIALCIRAVRRYHIGPLQFQWAPRGWPAFIRASVPFGLTSLALTLNFSADSVILGWFHSSTEVGLYTAAYSLVFSVVGIVGGFLKTFTPSIAREHVHSPERVRAWTRTSTQWLMLFALPAATGLALLAPQITTLLYGASFAQAGILLTWLCWDIPLLLFAAFCGNVTAAVGLERPASRIFTISVILNVILNILFIPSFGNKAAVVVTLMTDTISTIAFFVLLHRHMQLSEIAPQLARIVVATALMALVVWLAKPLPLPLVIGLGALCYVGFACALGLFDRAMLDKITRRFKPAS